MVAQRRPDNAAQLGVEGAPSWAAQPERGNSLRLGRHSMSRFAPAVESPALGCDPIATIRQDSCWRPVFALTERPRSVVNVAPVSGLGAEEETRATLIWVRAWK